MVRGPHVCIERLQLAQNAPTTGRQARNRPKTGNLRKQLPELIICVGMRRSMLPISLLAPALLIRGYRCPRGTLQSAARGVSDERSGTVTLPLTVRQRQSYFGASEAPFLRALPPSVGTHFRDLYAAALRRVLVWRAINWRRADHRPKSACRRARRTAKSPLHSPRSQSVALHGRHKRPTGCRAFHPCLPKLTAGGQGAPLPLCSSLLPKSLTINGLTELASGPVATLARRLRSCRSSIVSCSQARPTAVGVMHQVADVNPTSEHDRYLAIFVSG